jgi:pyruvate kinase
MLESMAKNPRPTRAEVSDVTNAVYDGADCVMLSGESAKGKYPAHTVQFMNEIIVAAETYAHSSVAFVDNGGELQHPDPRTQVPFRATPTIEATLAKSAVSMAAQRSKCTAILVLSNYGSLPPLVSAFRPDIPIVVLCPTPKLARQLQIYRGVYPILMNGGTSSSVGDSKGMSVAVQEAKKYGYVQSGDEVVFVSREYNDEVKGTVQIATVA